MTSRRPALLVVAAVLFVLAVTTPVGLATHIVDSRKARAEVLAARIVTVSETKRDVLHAICLGRQDTYDSQIRYTRDFLGPELHATPVQIELALAHQRQVLDARPRCGASASSTGTRGTVSP